MGRRRYFCDYCDKRIPSGLNHRKTHQQSIQHLQNKRNYFREYLLDPVTLLHEEQLKRACHQWMQKGSCSYGEKCKYSHRSNEELIQIIQKNENTTPPFDIQQWIETKLSHVTYLPESLSC